MILQLRNLLADTHTHTHRHTINFSMKIPHVLYSLMLLTSYHINVGVEEIIVFNVIPVPIRPDLEGGILAAAGKYCPCAYVRLHTQHKIYYELIYDFIDP